MTNNNIFESIKLEKYNGRSVGNNPTDLVTCSLPLFKVTGRNDGIIEGHGIKGGDISIRDKLLAPVANTFRISSFL